MKKKLLLAYGCIALALCLRIVAPAEGEVVPTEGEISEGEEDTDIIWVCGTKDPKVVTKDLLANWLLISLSLGCAPFRKCLAQKNVVCP